MKGLGVEDGTTVGVGSRKGIARLETDGKEDEKAPKMIAKIVKSRRLRLDVKHVTKVSDTGMWRTSKAQVDNLRAGDDNIGNNRKEE
jgi:hypothetical protein